MTYETIASPSMIPIEENIIISAPPKEPAIPRMNVGINIQRNPIRFQHPLQVPADIIYKHDTRLADGNSHKGIVLVLISVAEAYIRTISKKIYGISLSFFHNMLFFFINSKKQTYMRSV